ncbi:hypothetical protein ACI3KX_04495 [Microbacterium sp. ZW CA_36]
MIIVSELRYAASRDEASAAVAEYAFTHEVSEREHQLAYGGTR